MSGSRRDRGEAFGDSDDDEDIEYGFRRARRDVSYEHRASSSLRPAQLMEQEVYYAVAEDLLHQSNILAGIVALLSLWLALESRRTVVIASAREKIQKIKDDTGRLLHLME